MERLRRKCWLDWVLLVHLELEHGTKLARAEESWLSCQALEGESAKQAQGRPGKVLPQGETVCFVLAAGFWEIGKIFAGGTEGFGSNSSDLRFGKGVWL